MLQFDGPSRLLTVSVRRNIDYYESKQLQLVMYTMEGQKTRSEIDANVT